MIGQVERTIVVQEGPQTTITGTLPPGLRDWLPWILAALALGGLYLLTRDGRDDRPLARGAG